MGREKVKNERRKMKGIKQILFLVIAGFLLSSCVTARKVNYMQEPDKHIPHYADTLSFEDYELRIGDRLYVYVYSLDEKVTAMYNAGGTSSSIRQQMQQSGSGGPRPLCCTGSHQRSKRRGNLC